MNGKKQDEISQSVYDATNQLTLSRTGNTVSNRPLNSLDRRTVADIQRKLVKWGKPKYGVSTYPRKERQGDDRRLEVEPRENPSGL